MSKKMENAPVYFTVAQIRFNPVLQLDGYLPAIQEKMRAAHVPDFRRETLQQLIVASPAEGHPPSPSFVPKAHYIFGNIDRTTEFILSNDSLALQTTAYETHDTFFKMLLAGLTIIHDALRLDFIERIGLRYFDAVRPKQDELLSAYLAPEVLGLHNKLEGKLVHSFSETFTRNASVQLVSRVIIKDGKVGLPPEIMPLAPLINQKFTKTESRHAIIDIDAFSEQREAFSLEKVSSKLNELYTESRKSFNATVTEFAIKAWK